ncbi:hypothetical protein [Nostoc sp. C052]|nr:hypothetical protein [Nostoc sp. C052]
MTLGRRRETRRSRRRSATQLPVMGHWALDIRTMEDWGAIADTSTQ